MRSVRLLSFLILLCSISGCVEPAVENRVQVNVVNQPASQATSQGAKQPVSIQALSVLRVTDGLGCPARDPSSFGVFLQSERQGNVLVCYYD